jgi:hypothetical protein
MNGVATMRHDIAGLADNDIEFIPQAASDETFVSLTPTPSAWARTPLA